MGGVSRDCRALRPPGRRSLEGFPRWRLTSRRALIRGHLVGNNPWWFASSGDGRFNLSPPHGTCHLALDRATAVRETVGERLATLGLVDEEFARQRYISTLRVPKSQLLADTSHAAAADYGLTRELVSMTPYSIPQSWARALHGTGFAGVRYQTRFTTASLPNAVALFGPAGERSWSVDDAPAAFAAAALDCGIRVVFRPRTVRTVEPP